MGLIIFILNREGNSVQPVDWQRKDTIGSKLNILMITFVHLMLKCQLATLDQAAISFLGKKMLVH